MSVYGADDGDYSFGKTGDHLVDQVEERLLAKA